MVVILAVGVTAAVAVVVVRVINSRQVMTYATHIPQTTRTTRLFFVGMTARTYALQGAQLRGQSLNGFSSFPQYQKNAAHVGDAYMHVYMYIHKYLERHLSNNLTLILNPPTPQY